MVPCHWRAWITFANRHKHLLTLAPAHAAFLTLLYPLCVVSSRPAEICAFLHVSHILLCTCVSSLLCLADAYTSFLEMKSRHYANLCNLLYSPQTELRGSSTLPLSFSTSSFSFFPFLSLLFPSLSAPCCSLGTFSCLQFNIFYFGL